MIKTPRFKYKYEGSNSKIGEGSTNNSEGQLPTKNFKKGTNVHCTLYIVECTMYNVHAHDVCICVKYTPVYGCGAHTCVCVTLFECKHFVYTRVVHE